MVLAYNAAAVSCRRPVVPVCDPTSEVTGATVQPAVDGQVILVRAGDIIDVGINWSAWLAANDALLATSAWAAHASTPDAPTQGSSGIDQVLGETITILDASAAVVGDIYWLVNTITVTDKTPSAADGAFIIPTRTLKRVIHVRIIA